MKDDLSDRQWFGLGVLAALAVIAVLAVAATIGAGATTELANETAEPTNDSAVEISVAWNDSITDPANESATVEFYNATEYENDAANATLVLSDEIAADEGNTTTVTYNVSDTALEAATSYQVIVSGNDTVIDDVAIETTGDSGGWLAPFEGNEGNVALLAILVVAFGAYRRRDS